MNPYIWGAIAIALLALAGGSYYAGDKHGKAHVQTLWDVDKAARDSALVKAQYALIDAQAARDKVVQQAEVDHEKLVADNQSIRDSFLASVLKYEAALRKHPVPAPVDDPGESVGSTPSPSSDPGASADVGQLNSAIAHAVQACQHDSAELAGILAIAPH